MNFEQALSVAQAAVNAQFGRQLREVETAILFGSWQDQTYEEIAQSSGYAVSYLKRDVGPKLWRLLGLALGKAINKTNFKAALKQQWLSSSQASLPITALVEQVAKNLHSSETDPNFVGRSGAIAHLDTLVNSGAKVILIQGEGGVGKTKLASEYLKRFDLVLPVWMAKDYENITSATSLVEEWLRRYFNEEPAREFGITLERLRQQLLDPTKRIGVLIDNLEPAVDGNGKFIEPHRPYVELLRVLASEDVRSLTLVTSRESLHEAAITVRHYYLEALDVTAWQEFFSSRHIRTDSTVLNAMHSAYGGNAKAMTILLGVIQEDYSGDVEAYWQSIQGDLLLEGDLRDLVVTQFNRLSQIDPTAFQLLCRLGCYRFSDVPSVPIEGLLSLLWDVPKAQRRRVVKSLQERSLVEFGSGEYWLHPVIRAEASARIGASEDWERANRTSAEFWTQSVKSIETTVDALRAMEAYYHYLEINDFEQAAAAIAKERANQWQNDEHLGSSFFRLGLLDQMTTAITRIINNIQPGYLLSEMYSILGGLYGMRGDTQSSIKCFVESANLATECLETIPNRNRDKEIIILEDLKLISLFSQGICYLDLWKLEEAVEVFQKVSSIAETKPELYEYAVYSWCCLAFVKSLSIKEEAETYLEKVHKEIFLAKLSAWGKGYSLLFLGKTYTNLGKFENSLEMYRRAIDYAQDSHYPQVRAKALSGLAELYREQKDLAPALSKHKDAIELLEKIGAKCDLAEAYYQLGLTYQKMGNENESHQQFQVSIRLFSEIKAPLQIEKVQQAMERRSGGVL
jgi:tetratricopeptide (TPR) repeat protein